MPTLIAQALTPFIAPALAWAGVAAVSIPVAIHLLSRWRRRPEPFGAMRFLLEAYRKQKRRMHFEQWLLLLLRCLIVLLLGLALARPRLVGALGGLFGGLDGQGRVVNIVIDDSLSTGAPDGPDATRFDRLIRSAKAVVDALETGDRATIWRAARPAGPVVADPTADRAALRRTLSKMRPGYSRPDLPVALGQIAGSLEARQAVPGRSVTVVLSDFLRSAGYVDRPPDPGLQKLGRLSELAVSRPMAGLNNVQVSSVLPRRRVVVLDGQAGGGVAVRVRVRRYADALPAGSVPLTVDLIDAEGRGLSSVQRRVFFSAGQSVASANVDLPAGASVSAPRAQGGVLLTLRAQIDPGLNGLTPDDQAHAVVELRRTLRVAVVDEPTNLADGSDTGLTPGQWVTLALRPDFTAAAGPVEVVPLTPADMNDPASLRFMDAVMLLRPDLLFESSWGGLSSYAEQGGLVWVFTPPSEGSAPWVGPMLKAFDTGWRVGLEPVNAVDTGGSTSLSSEPLSAEPLERLAADWQALTRPVRVDRRLPLEVTGSDAWVSLARADQPGGGDADADTLLAHHTVGRGSLLLLSTAVDTRWTNLPAKPLFVPLIHETLRGVLGARAIPGVIEAVAGDRPALGPTWSGIASMDRLAVSGDLVTADPGTGPTADRLTFMTGEAGVQLAQPVVRPGVYQATTDAGPRRLVVNADPQAGDTRQINEETLTHWLSGIGAWRWIEDDDPGSVLRRSAAVSDIGWVLLWVLLALVVTETLAARWLSHANAGPGRSLTGRLWRAAFQSRSGERPGSGGRGRAA
jgi:Aerotolerance regulator N-terminal